MAWLWSDDLARMLVAEGQAEPSQVAEWIASPVAFAVDDEADPRVLGPELLGLERTGRSVA